MNNTKVDIDKLLVSLFNMTPISKENKYLLQEALKKQGLVFNGTEITSIKESKEPLFNAGDWVVYDGLVTQIVRVDVDGYVNSEQGFIPKDREDCMRLWNIEDAKSSDVLYTPKGRGVEGIFIVDDWKKVEDIGRTLCSDIGYRVDDDEIIAGGLGAIWWKGVIDPFYPATKEQRDLLFEKIREKGFEYDSKKKRYIRKKVPKEYSIIIDGVRHNLIKPEIEDCKKCSLDKFCDRFKEALCDALVGRHTGMIFEKKDSSTSTVV